MMQQPFSLQGININCGRAYDIRTGKYWFIRMFQVPHGIDVWRDEKGVLQVRPRESSASSALESLENAGGHLPAPRMLVRQDEGCK